MSGIGRYYRRIWKKADGQTVEAETYTISFPFEGQTRREKTTARTESQAKLALKNRLEQIGRGQYVARQDNVTLTQLVDLLKAKYRNNANRSLDDALAKLKPVLDHFRGWRVSRITIERIDKFVDLQLAEGKEIATVNGYLRYLRLLFNLGLEKRILAHAPRIHILAGENRRAGFIDPGDFERFLSLVVDPDVADLVEFLYYTGWRVSAACGLTHTLVNNERSTLTMTSAMSKNKKPLELPYGGRLGAIMERRRVKRRLDCPFVFHRDGKPFTRWNFRDDWRDAAAAAKVPHLIPHDLCRSVARNLSKGGVNEVVASKYMNRSAPMFRQYRIVDSEDLAEAGRALDGIHEEPKVEDIEKVRKG